MFRCSICFAVLDCTRLLKFHLTKDHGYNSESAFQCGQGCSRLYSSWKCFQRHVVSCKLLDGPVAMETEPEPIEIEVPRAIGSPSHEYSYDISYDISSFFEHDDAQDRDINFDVAEFLKGFKTKSVDNAMMFVGKLYSDPDLTRSHVQSVVDSTTQLVSANLELVTTAIVSVLSQHNASELCISQVKTCLNLLQKPFADVHSDHLRMKHLTRHGYFISPEKFVCGRDPNKLSDNQLTAEFIPFRKVLKCLFELPNVFTSVKNYLEVLHEESAHNVISNFVQGEFWTEKMKYFAGRLVLPLFVYFDELETGNPLGSHAGIFKIGAVYIWCPCLPPEYISLLENYLLAQLCYGDDRKSEDVWFEASNNRILFMKIVAELNFLSTNGISVKTEQGIEQLYFCLGLILGDNLGMNGILGFVENFTANYCCRLCKIHKSVSASATIEDPSLWRSVDDYRNDVALNDTAMTGIKEDSVWNLVQLYEVVHNFSLDWMHDVLEGCAVYDLTEILFNFVFVEEFLTIEQLTYRMVHYDYGPSSNKPPAIAEADLRESRIKMSSSEMLTFIRVLGPMIGDLIPIGNEHWQLYLFLADIVNILSCQQLEMETVHRLGYLVQQHHILYVKLFGPTLKPKHHNMLHYSTIIRFCGPMVLLWSMRPESRHRLLKRSANVIASRVDIILSLAIKNQLAFAYRIMSRQGFSKRLTVSHSSTYVQFASLLDFIDVPIIPSGFEMCTIVNSVTSNGTIYKKDVCIVIGIDDLGSPVFGLIDKVLLNADEDVCFTVSVLSNEYTNKHLHSNIVSLSNSLTCVKLINLVSHSPVYFGATATGHSSVSLHHLL